MRHHHKDHGKRMVSILCAVYNDIHDFVLNKRGKKGAPPKHAPKKTIDF